MLIQSLPGFSNIGHRMDGQRWVQQKWNPRYHQVNQLSDTGLPCCDERKWMLMRETSPIFSHGRVTDANRNWTTPYQDITIGFTHKLQDAALSVDGTATGHTISVNGTPQTTTYRSGSGTTEWTFRIPVLLEFTDAVTYSYSQSTGNTTSVTYGTELMELSNRPVCSQLTERIRFTLRKSNGDLATNETVKLGVFTYNSGTVDTEGTSCAYWTGTWMKREMEVVATTDANGVLDVLYTGTSVTCGGSVYIVVFRPNTTPTESMAWVDTVK